MVPYHKLSALSPDIDSGTPRELPGQERQAAAHHKSLHLHTWPLDPDPPRSKNSGRAEGKVDLLVHIVKRQPSSIRLSGLC